MPFLMSAERAAAIVKRGLARDRGAHRLPVPDVLRHLAPRRAPALADRSAADAAGEESAELQGCKRLTPTAPASAASAPVRHAGDVAVVLGPGSRRRRGRRCRRRRSRGPSCVVRMQHRRERARPGLAIGPGGRPGDRHRCCRGWRPARSAWASGRPSGALAVGERVDDRRVGLQPHARASRLRNTAATCGRSAGHAGLLLDDRGQRHAPRAATQAAGAGRAPAHSSASAVRHRLAACARPAARAAVAPL